ncbi:drug/metabolite transporter (DMT)-like permease [Amaricoccus macauensis]|uniref:Drug/metabolite transporter (DMT)-like permease n=1 Tax=Amaricoccus macauensis TaxID=57001 RepID=A0A840SLH4_9RHOB|nr:DMT family transporter [Amaricoccus macauensis]MBB5223959.1 drug/metabolite transporter (DMT)-like permease [Amaricoccus macauensis]
MSAIVFAAVLCGAALHASWNAIVKGGSDTLLSTVLVAASSSLIALAVVPFLPLPAPESWPYLVTSAALQLLYFALVAAAYRATDMSRAYPLMRGLAPTLVAIFGATFLGQHLSAIGWAGIGLVSTGVFAMAFAVSGTGVATSRRGTAFALTNAAVIATYTLVDGTGVRLSGAPIAYSMWLFVLAMPILVWAIATRGCELRIYARTNLWRGIVGGLGTLGSYGITLWAMTRAPVAMVAALRETAIIFGLAIAAVVLGERVGPIRVAAAGLIVLGAITLRLA